MVGQLLQQSSAAHSASEYKLVKEAEFMLEVLLVEVATLVNWCHSDFVFEGYFQLEDSDFDMILHSLDDSCSHCSNWAPSSLCSMAGQQHSYFDFSYLYLPHTLPFGLCLARRLAMPDLVKSCSFS